MTPLGEIEIALDSALMLYLLRESPPWADHGNDAHHDQYGGRKGTTTIFNRAGSAFQALEEEQPDHIAVRQYHIFKQAAGKRQNPFWSALPSDWLHFCGDPGHYRRR